MTFKLVSCLHFSLGVLSPRSQLDRTEIKKQIGEAFIYQSVRSPLSVLIKSFTFVGMRWQKVRKVLGLESRLFDLNAPAHMVQP